MTLHIPPKVLKMIDRAIAEGRHHAGPDRQFCGGCRQWVSSIYWVDQGKRLCPDCADRCGQGPKADERRQRERAQRNAQFRHGGNVL